MPLGSLREEFLIPGRRFVAGRNWGGEAVDEKNLTFSLVVYLTHIKLHSEVGLHGNICSTQGQAALTAATDVIKESVWFIIVYCFFAVSGVKFLQ